MDDESIGAEDQVESRSGDDMGKEMLEALEGVAAVARRRNSLLLIQRLPPEILSACIGHVVAGVEPHNHQQMLMRLSAISSWWRQVALSTRPRRIGGLVDRLCTS